MGTRYIRQGKCTVCKTLTHDYCDSCSVYICEDHRNYKEAKSGGKTHIFCKKCFNSHKKPIDPEGRQV